jgi:hypothetical protein
MSRSIVVAGFALALMAGPAWAQGAGVVEVARASEAEAHGACAPSFVAVNRTAQPVDYLQIDVSFALPDGRRQTMEFRSAYAGGVERPIAPGESAPLRIQPDLSRPILARCAELGGAELARIECASKAGSCAAAVTVDVRKR